MIQNSKSITALITGLTAVIFLFIPVKISADDKIDVKYEVTVIFLREKIVNYALSMQGVDYRPGGQSPEYGYDCSGFTQHVYSRFGMKIPRKSAVQYSKAVKIIPAALHKGDLVFFNTRGMGATHVGIYIGSGKFIHAPGIGKTIRVDSLSKKYWSGCFVSGGRYIF